jgi:hypothetical protein
VNTSALDRADCAARPLQLGRAWGGLAVAQGMKAAKQRGDPFRGFRAFNKLIPDIVVVEKLSVNLKSIKQAHKLEK